jgi:hypothetical protein
VIGFQAVLNHRIRQYQEARSIFAIVTTAVVVVSNNGASVRMKLLTADSFRSGRVRSTQKVGHFLVLHGVVETDDFLGLAEQNRFQSVEIHALFQAFVGERKALCANARFARFRFVTVQFC